VVCCDGESGHFVVGAYLSSSNNPKTSVTSPTHKARMRHHSQSLSRETLERLDNNFERVQIEEVYTAQSDLYELIPRSGAVEYCTWLMLTGSTTHPVEPLSRSMIGNWHFYAQEARLLSISANKPSSFRKESYMLFAGNSRNLSVRHVLFLRLLVHLAKIVHMQAKMKDHCGAGDLIDLKASPLNQRDS
jgi:hypothetical protein